MKTQPTILMFIAFGFILFTVYRFGYSKAIEQEQSKTAQRYFDAIGEPETDSEIMTFERVVYNNFNDIEL